MYCKNCGNKMEDDWKACPKCGQGINEFLRMEGEKSSSRAKKGSKKWIGIVVIVIVVLGILLGISSSDGGNEDAEKLVKEGFYGIYDVVTIQDILEYNWEGGYWDSFISEADASEILIVEYVKDRDRNSLIQFEVEDDLSSFELVHFKVDGNPYGLSEANAMIEEMHLNYFEAKYPVKDIDLADYINGDINELLSVSKAFSMIDEEGTVCQNMTKTVNLLVESDKVYCIELEGDGGYAPSFANVQLGDNVSSIDTSKLESMGYSYIEMTTDEMVLFGNMDTLEGVGFAYDEQGVINYIIWMNNLVEIEEEYIVKEVDILQFVGLVGAYEPMRIAPDANARIDFYIVDDTTVRFDIYIFELDFVLFSGDAKIVSEKLMTYEGYSFAIDFTWTSQSTLTVSNRGEITGMDAKILDDVTNNVDYKWSAEFN